MDDAVRTTIEERDGGRVATVTVDYQPRLNLLDRSRSDRLRDAFVELADDEELRVAAITA